MIEKKIETIKYIAKDGTEFEDREQCLKYDALLKNLYQETIDKLECNNKTIKDVKYVKYNGDWYTTIDQFLEVAKDIYYEKGYGCVYINETIIIVGFNWWLERNEYDGAEWWEYKEMPHRENATLKDITKSEIIYGDSDD